MHMYGPNEASSLTVDASGKQVFIYDTLTVTNGLQLNSGRLNTRSGLVSVGKILINPANKSVVAPGASYIDGPLEIVVQSNSADSIIFPVGTAFGARPLAIYLANSSIGNWDKIIVSARTRNHTKLTCIKRYFTCLRCPSLECNFK